MIIGTVFLIALMKKQNMYENFLLHTGIDSQSAFSVTFNLEKKLNALHKSIKPDEVFSDDVFSHLNFVIKMNDELMNQTKITIDKTADGKEKDIAEKIVKKWHTDWGLIKPYFQKIIDEKYTFNGVLTEHFQDIKTKKLMRIEINRILYGIDGHRGWDYDGYYSDYFKIFETQDA